MLYSKKLQSILLLFTSIILSLSAADAYADIIFIANSSKKEVWTEKQVRDLYLGTLKLQQIELVDQAAGQTARNEFYEKFLKKSESQLKQKWSILVFSGEKVPLVVANDRATYEYVKSHPDSIGYVSKEFWEKEASTISTEGLMRLFSVQ
jgi:ABC-type phosphate transport system substrate-binding protein